MAPSGSRTSRAYAVIRSRGDGGSALFPAVTGAPMRAPNARRWRPSERLARVGCTSAQTTLGSILSGGIFGLSVAGEASNLIVAASLAAVVVSVRCDGESAPHRGEYRQAAGVAARQAGWLFR